MSVTVKAWLFVILASPLLAAFAVALGFSLPADGYREVAVMLIIFPFLEEWVFRALLQEELASRWPHVVWPNLLSSSIFVLFHWQGQGLYLLAWFIPALVLGEAWRRHGSLPLNVFLHAWFNLSLWVAGR